MNVNRECTTHHYACDCREAEFAAIKAEKAELVEACKDVILSAEYSDKVADFVSSCELGEAINRMRAALHKAEGKE